MGLRQGRQVRQGGPGGRKGDRVKARLTPATCGTHALSGVKKKEKKKGDVS